MTAYFDWYHLCSIVLVWCFALHEGAGDISGTKALCNLFFPPGECCIVLRSSVCVIVKDQGHKGDGL